MTPYKAHPIFHATKEVLRTFSEDDLEGVAWAAYEFVMDNMNGLPDMSLVTESARRDALFWVDTAQPHEVEAYALAAINKLKNMQTTFSDKHRKSLISALWQGLSERDQYNFVKYISTHNKISEDK
jgi:hypothetical protein